MCRRLVIPLEEIVNNYNIEETCDIKTAPAGLPAFAVYSETCREAANSKVTFRF